MGSHTMAIIAMESAGQDKEGALEERGARKTQAHTREECMVTIPTSKCSHPLSSWKHDCRWPPQANPKAHEK